MVRDCEPHMNGGLSGPVQAALIGHAKGLSQIKNALVALGVASVLIAWPWLSGRVSIPWDAKAHFLPQLQFLAASLAAGESPFWTPYIFSGHPQIADAQSLIFSPPMLLLALLNAAPTPWAIDLALFSSVIAGAAAFMLWLTGRDIHPAAALLAALGFAFGAAMAWRIQHVGQVLTLSYLPFVLLFLDRALARRSSLYAATAGTAAAALVLGRDQVGLLSVYFLIAYVLWTWFESPNPLARIKSSMPVLLMAGITGLAIIALPILMTSLLAAASNRASIDFVSAARGSLHPALFLTAIAPDVFGSSGVMGEYWGPPSMRWQGTGLYIAQNMGQHYIGAVPALALIWGFASGAIFEPRARLFLAAFAVAILYALGWYTPFFKAFHALLPGVNLYRRPADAVFLIGFLAAVLSAFALDRIFSQGSGVSRKTSFRVAVVLALAFLAMIALAVHFEKLQPAWRHIAVPCVLFGLGGLLLLALGRARGAMRETLIAALALFTAADLAYSNGPGGATALAPETFEVLDPATANETIAKLKELTRAGASPTRRDRVELVGFGFHWPNASLTHGLEMTLGYNPVRLSHYNRAVGAGDHVGLPEQKGFSPLLPSYRSTLANMLGLRYIATSVPIEKIDTLLAPDDLPLVAKTRDGFIYENPRTLPRVGFAHKALKADFEDLLTTGVWPDADFAETVLLDGPLQDGRERKPGSARILAYRNTSITLEAESPDGGYVVLNDIWHPWWFASVDSAPAEIHRANVIFRAIAVPPGKHRIDLNFEPIRGALQEAGILGKTTH